MHITQALHRAVACRPDGIATVCGSRRHTFAQFRERISRLAAALHALGVGNGDRVGILSLNSDRYVEAYMAVPWAGAVINRATRAGAPPRSPIRWTTATRVCCWWTTPSCPWWPICAPRAAAWPR
jgi:non-ribosomal peptide synthetase component F